MKRISLSEYICLMVFVFFAKRSSFYDYSTRTKQKRKCLGCSLRDKSILLLKRLFSPFTFQSECLSFTYLFTLLKSKTYGSLKAKGEARIFGGSLDKCPQISGHKDTKEQKQLRLGVLHHQGSLLSYPGERGERHIDTSARHALNSSITALPLFLHSALSLFFLSRSLFSFRQ